mmetsp:Transcript_54566/g.130179  ORF Transcript_54566/g.130179 Transcript_54566/m.130179 type:complete len:594 (+) Transcript_54566:74-1855(+)
MGAGYSTCCSQSILPAGCIASSANALPACVGEAVSESTSAEGRAAIGLEARLAFQRSRLFTRSSCIPPLEVLTLGKFLGSGSFGCVYSAFSLRHRRANEDDFSAAFAVKVFGKSALSGSKDPSDLRMWAARCESFRVERAMLAALEHPHIVLLRESFESHADMQLAMEQCTGDLYSTIVRGEEGLSQSRAQHLFWQIAYTVNYLHSFRIVHRDLKVDNWLLSGMKEGLEVVKLCDFGSAVCLQDGENIAPGSAKTRGLVGTLSYHAPEVLCAAGQSLRADDWALGVLLYVMLVGEHPFKTPLTQDAVVMERICAGAVDRKRSRWQALPHDTKELVGSLLCVDQELRARSYQLLSHPWVAEASPAQQGQLAQILDAHALQSVVELMEMFRCLDELQRLILVIAARFFPRFPYFDRSRDEVAGLCDVPWYSLFVALDADRDGRISIDEFMVGTKRTNWGPARILQVKALDVDDSGYIEWCEWASLAVLAAARTDAALFQEIEPLHSILRLLDTPTGDGILTVEDLLVSAVPIIQDDPTCGYSYPSCSLDEVGAHAAENCLAMLVRKWGGCASKGGGAIGLQLHHLQRMMLIDRFR